MKEPTVVLSIRIPVSLHARLQAMAEAEDRSLNRMILHLVREAVNRRQADAPPRPEA